MNALSPHNREFPDIIQNTAQLPPLPVNLPISVKGLRLHLQDEKWAFFHSFMHASRRHETSGLERKNFIVDSTVAAWVSCLQQFPLPLSPTWQHGRGPDGCCKGTGCASQPRNVKIREPKSFVMDYKQIYRLARRESYLSSKAACCTDIFEKIVWSKRTISASAYKMSTNSKDHGELSPDSLSWLTHLVPAQCSHHALYNLCLRKYESIL